MHFKYKPSTFPSKLYAMHSPPCLLFPAIAPVLIAQFELEAALHSCFFLFTFIYPFVRCVCVCMHVYLREGVKYMMEKNLESEDL